MFKDNFSDWLGDLAVVTEEVGKPRVLSEKNVDGVIYTEIYVLECVNLHAEILDLWQGIVD